MDSSEENNAMFVENGLISRKDDDRNGSEHSNHEEPTPTRREESSMDEMSAPKKSPLLDEEEQASPDHSNEDREKQQEFNVDENSRSSRDDDQKLEAELDMDESFNLNSGSKKRALIEEDDVNSESRFSVLGKTEREQFADGDSNLLQDDHKRNSESEMDEDFGSQSVLKKRKWFDDDEEQNGFETDENSKQNSDDLEVEDSDMNFDPHKKKKLGKSKKNRPIAEEGQDSSRPVRLSKKKAEEEIHKESQRLIRETKVRLPYHVPKDVSLDHFIALTMSTVTPEAVQTFPLSEKVEFIEFDVANSAPASDRSRKSSPIPSLEKCLASLTEDQKRKVESLVRKQRKAVGFASFPEALVKKPADVTLDFS